MNKFKAGLIIVSLAFHFVCTAQQPSSEEIRLPETILQFVPKDYVLIDTAMGDLNLDAHKDVIILLKHRDEGQTEEEQNRPLLLLLGGANKSFQLAARNDKILSLKYTSSAFTDPYEKLVIQKGSFSVSQIDGGAELAAETTITFKYASVDKNWYLYRVTEESWTRERTVRGIKKADVQRKTYTRKNFGAITLNEYKGWDAHM